MKFYRLFSISLLVALTGFFARAAHEVDEKDSLTIGAYGKSITVDLKTLLEKEKLPVVTVELEDPVYHRKMKFDGFDLYDLLEKIGGMDLKTAPPSDVLVFTAKDGYAPISPVKDFLQSKSRPILAFQEHGAGRGNFGLVAQGKAMVSPAPYYVVWKNPEALESKVQWPYQLAKIELVKFEDKFKKTVPGLAAVGSPVHNGFMIFRNNCFTCHSINLEGGDIGPELNVPMNVTEYWKKKTMKKFIANAWAFRTKSKMPPFPQLKDQELEDVMAYIRAMMDSKQP